METAVVESTETHHALGITAFRRLGVVEIALGIVHTQAVQAVFQYRAKGAMRRWVAEMHSTFKVRKTGQDPAILLYYLTNAKGGEGKNPFFFSMPILPWYIGFGVCVGQDETKHIRWFGTSFIGIVGGLMQRG